MISDNFEGKNCIFSLSIDIIIELDRPTFVHSRHRCPHDFPEEHLEIPHDEPILTVSSYHDEFDEKHVERRVMCHHEDHLHMEGDFVGERRTDYVATRGERAPVKRPEDNLRPEGEFYGRPKEEAPKRGERMPIKRPQDNLKPEGDIDGKRIFN